MTVRIIYFCPRCGGQSYRHSSTRLRKDAILSAVGIHSFRCHICRLRFYLFQPSILWSIAAEPAQLTTASELKPLKTPALGSWDTRFTD